uniref:DUF3421 domain-containing protein n=1 Tax=Rhabditophanes sp. KR3021 TaxID=114890 RepID=A0AC35TJD9_9BILA
MVIKMKLLIFICLFVELECFYRYRRQAFPPNPAPYQPRFTDYNLPPYYNPYPGRDASDISGPAFPMTSTYNMGVDVNPGTRVSVDGNLNIPIPGWGIDDLKGGIRVGRPNVRASYGQLLNPINTFKLSPETIETIAQSPQFNEARDKLPSEPVAVLPGNFVPLRCKKPMCNNFVNTAAFGLEVERSLAYFVDGGIDFAVPVERNGVGYRMPLSGGINAGLEPIVIGYGQQFGPTIPDHFERKVNRKKSSLSDIPH